MHLTLAYTADSEPGTFEADQSQGADVFIHEVAPSPEEFSEKNYIPLPIAQNVMHQHTQPQDLGRVFDIARPRLGVGMHFPTADDLIDPLFERWTSTFDGPLLLVQDLTTINVTADQITVRQAKTDPLAWASPPSGKRPDTQPGPPSEAQRPAWLSETRLKP